jgi:hypothetical protein
MHVSHPSHRFPLLVTAAVALLVAGCTAVEHGSGAPPAAAGGDSIGTAAHAKPGDTAIAAAAPAGSTSVAAAAHPQPPTSVDSALLGRVARTPDTLPSPVIRALYANRWATHSWKKMHHLIAIADSTEINGIVLDLKDEFGLNYRPTNRTFAANAGNAGTIPDLQRLLDTIKAHGIVPIARMVVFKDSVTARVHPEWTIRKADGSIWRDKKGIAWVNPYHRELWAYNIGVAEELAKRGFPEIQFDYIRFPEPYPSLPRQVFPGSGDVSKPRVLAGYLEEAKRRLNALGTRSTADIFGLVTQVHGALEVGQEWEQISPHVNVVLPMVYPSLYPHGQGGIANPNAEPYPIIKAALVSAHERDEKLGISTAEHVRPWLQAFNLGKPDYGPAQLRDEKRAVYDAGYDGWVLWNPGSNYDVFLPALEKTLVSRKRKP